ncbi:MAG TPA: hypothetical protein VMD59_02580 [Acidimicrobiales bacterium]|nr:hypothetical protein [Acidimicrobiales bacterium]
MPGQGSEQLFQNDPTATPPANRVSISDDVGAAELDLSSFSFGPVRFGAYFVTPPAGVQNWTARVDLRPAQDVFVDIACFDPTSSTAIRSARSTPCERPRWWRGRRAARPRQPPPTRPHRSVVPVVAYANWPGW